MFIGILGLHISLLGLVSAATPPHGPSFLRTPENRTAHVGDYVDFSCRTLDYANHSIGTPNHGLITKIHFNSAERDVADLHWSTELFQSEKVDTINGGTRKLVNEKHVLTIEKIVDTTDEGWYHCEACIVAAHAPCVEAPFYLDILDYEPVVDPVVVTDPVAVTSPPTEGPESDDFVIEDIEIESARSTCQVFGDPHFLTYDSTPYSFMGSSCHYVLALDAEAYSWFVYGKTEACGLYGIGTCLSAVTIYYGRDAVTLERGWLINHQGSKVEPLASPLQAPIQIGEHFVASFDGSHLEVAVTLSEREEGNIKYTTKLVVKWDGYVSAFIQSPLETSSFGLCGNNDADPNNDLYTPRYAVQVLGDIDEFGQSWKVDSRGQCGEVIPVAPVADICGDRLANLTEECERVFAISNFDECSQHHEKQSWIDACVYDECKGLNVRNILFLDETEDFDQKLSPKCVVAQAYALRCSSKNWAADGTEKFSGDVGGWEEEAGCPTPEEKEDIIPYQGCPQSLMFV